MDLIVPKSQSAGALGIKHEGIRCMEDILFDPNVPVNGNVAIDACILGSDMNNGMLISSAMVERVVTYRYILYAAGFKPALRIVRNQYAAHRKSIESIVFNDDFTARSHQD